MTGALIQGKWTPGWYDTGRTEGEFVRAEARFRRWVTADGSSGFETEPGRYHLYVSYACPWAHRALIFRSLKRLEAAVPVSVVEPIMSDEGWAFSPSLPDRVNGFGHLHQVYTAAKPDYTGRVTVPVLWDTKTHTIVSNESADIIRMLNSAFDAFTEVRADYYPVRLRKEIDAVNDYVYAHVNNGVYRCGFATTQKAYEAAFDRLFDALDTLERRLADARYLVGGVPTEADWRLFTTLVRFDAVYHGHFKCNLRRIEDYPNLSNYLRDLYQVPGIAETVKMDHIKRHYYMSHPHVNPTRIVPKGPLVDLVKPHDRGRFGPA
ncbi:MAG: glutathione-dependent reductase [Burkholderiales bacterium]|nr:MAG: glutathione-dependent reductase [Burkholderiales bacterium]